MEWTHVSLPGSDGLHGGTMTAWAGGFVAIAWTSASTYGVWLSADGANWRRSLDAKIFYARTITSFGDGLVISGEDTSRLLGTVPASRWSADGQTWEESLAPVDGQNVGLDYATRDGDRLVALGVSNFDPHVACSEGYFPTAPPLMSPTFWVSADGKTWRQAAGSAPLYHQDTSAMASLNGHIVIATSWNNQTTVSIGDVP
jgi:hypothetical protein